MNMDIEILIGLVSIVIGGLMGALMIAYRIRQTLRIMQGALLDGQLTQAEIIAIVTDLLSYRNLLGGHKIK